jgi:ferredoxin
MTAKEKAKELFDKYFSEIRMPSDCEGCMQCIDKCGNMVAIAKKYSLIAVDEILKALENELLDLYDTARDCPINKKHNKFFNEVKTEIEKL